MSSIQKVRVPHFIFLAALAFVGWTPSSHATDPSPDQAQLIAQGRNANENLPLLFLALDVADALLAPANPSETKRVSERGYIDDTVEKVCLPNSDPADELAQAVGGPVCLPDGSISKLQAASSHSSR